MTVACVSVCVCVCAGAVEREGREGMAGLATDLPDEADSLLQDLPSSWVEEPMAKVSRKA